jgi:hypothetical protein
MSLSREYTEEEYNTLESKAKQFHDALFSEPIDENFIVELLISTTNEERQIIRKFYKDSYNTPVQNDIKLRLQNELKTIAINLFDTPYEYDAKELYKIFSSPKIDDDSIVELFASRPKAHFETVEIAYKKFYNRDLKDDIKNHLPKEHAEFLLAIMENERPIDQTISGNDAYEDASELIKVGLKEYGIDVQKFKKIFINRSREDLILISRAYYEKTQKNLYEAIEEEVEGKNKELLKGVVFAVITPPQFFSEKCSKEIQNHGINGPLLQRILISRAEIDMYAIKDYYIMETNNDLKNEFEVENPTAYIQILEGLTNK